MFCSRCNPKEDAGRKGIGEPAENGEPLFSTEQIMDPFLDMDSIKGAENLDLGTGRKSKKTVKNKKHLESKTVPPKTECFFSIA